MSEKYRPPGFDQHTAINNCKVNLCAIGNDTLSIGKGYCMYMEQTSGSTNPEITTEILATDPGYAGWMKDKCPYGEIIFNIRKDSQ